MNVLHIRFGHSLLSTLARATLVQKQFQRLLADRPTGVRVACRSKQPHADLNSRYTAITLRSAGATAGAMLLSFLLYPEHIPTVGQGTRRPAIIHVEHIPETVQRTQPPAPPRPVVPIAVEGDVPDTVTIEPTDLDLDAIPIDLSLSGPPGGGGPLSDEPMDASEIDYKPHLLTLIMPAFPSEARRDRLKSGSAKVKLLVDKRGKVEKVEFVDGPAVFREEAISTAYRYRFRPGKHQGEVRKVWMEISIQFRYD